MSCLTSVPSSTLTLLSWNIQTCSNRKIAALPEILSQAPGDWLLALQEFRAPLSSLHSLSALSLSLVQNGELAFICPSSSIPPSILWSQSWGLLVKAGDTAILNLHMANTATLRLPQFSSTLSIISSFLPLFSYFIICGDFNFDLSSPNQNASSTDSSFIQSLGSLGFSLSMPPSFTHFTSQAQTVNTGTPRILDFFLSTNIPPLSSLCIPTIGYSDHCIVQTSLPHSRPHLPHRCITHYFQFATKNLPLPDRILQSKPTTPSLQTGVTAFLSALVNLPTDPPVNIIQNFNITHPDLALPIPPTKTAIWQSLFIARLASLSSHHESKIPATSHRKAIDKIFKKKSCSLNLILDDDNHPLRTPTEITSYLAHKSAPIFSPSFCPPISTKSLLSLLPPLPPETCQQTAVLVSASEISEIMLNLKKRKPSIGPDHLNLNAYLTPAAPTPSTIASWINDVSRSTPETLPALLPPQLLDVALTYIPKKQPPTFANLRPIAVGNTILKIASICVNKRLVSFLPTLATDTQHGFLPGRSAAIPISILNSFAEKGHPILLLDFSRAFTNTLQSRITQIADALPLHPSLKTWLSILTAPHTAHLTHSLPTHPVHINIARGVRQGDPASPSIFLLLASLIPGVVKKHFPLTITLQFADDTALIFPVGPIDLVALDACLKEIEMVTAIPLNFGKFQTLNFPPSRFANPSPTSPVTYLGSQIPISSHRNTQLLNIIQNTKYLHIRAHYLKLPLYLRAYLFNTYVYSKIVYLAQTSPLTPSIISELEWAQREIMGFTLPRKPSSPDTTTPRPFYYGPALSILTRPPTGGGFGLINPQLHSAALRVIWLRVACGQQFFPPSLDSIRLQICNHLSSDLKSIPQMATRAPNGLIDSHITYLYLRKSEASSPAVQLWLKIRPFCLPLPKLLQENLWKLVHSCLPTPEHMFRHLPPRPSPCPHCGNTCLWGPSHALLVPCTGYTPHWRSPPPFHSAASWSDNLAFLLSLPHPQTFLRSLSNALTHIQKQNTTRTSPKTFSHLRYRPPSPPIVPPPSFTNLPVALAVSPTTTQYKFDLISLLKRHKQENLNAPVHSEPKRPKIDPIPPELLFKTLKSLQRVPTSLTPPPQKHNTMNIFTDGSASGSRAGAAWVVLSSHNLTNTTSGYYAYGPVSHLPSNNRAELTALLWALKFAKAYSTSIVTIHSDSEWVVNTYNKKFACKSHLDLWAEIDNLRSPNIVVRWVKAHSTNLGNCLADLLAKKGSRLTYKSHICYRISRSTHLFSFPPRRPLSPSAHYPPSKKSRIDFTHLPP